MNPSSFGIAVCLLSVFVSGGIFVAQARLRAGASRKDAVKEGAAFALFMIAGCFNLDGCYAGTGLYESRTVEQPTLAGNRVASETSVLAGAVRTSRVTSPDGANAVERCIAIQQRYMRWLAENGLTASNSPFGWWLAQGAITVPDRCIDHVTSGTPMNWGAGGMVGGRMWIR